MDCGQTYSATDLKVQASLPTRGRIHCNAFQGPWPSCCNLWPHIQGNASATSIVGPRYPCYCSPEFYAQFWVAKERPDGPFQRLVERCRQPFGHHVVRLQDPGADGVHPEGTPVIKKKRAGFSRSSFSLLGTNCHFYSPMNKHRDDHVDIVIAPGVILPSGLKGTRGR